MFFVLFLGFFWIVLYFCIFCYCNLFWIVYNIYQLNMSFYLFILYKMSKKNEQLRKCHATIVDDGNIITLWSFTTPQIAIVRFWLCPGVYEFIGVRWSRTTSRQKTRFKKDWWISDTQKITLDDFVDFFWALEKPTRYY